MGRARRDDERIIGALAHGLNQAEASRVTGVSERTIRRRMQDPDFRDRVAAVRGEIARAAAAQLESLYAKAIGTLEQLLDDRNADRRLRAAQLVLKVGRSSIPIRSSTNDFGHSSKQ